MWKTNTHKIAAFASPYKPSNQAEKGEHHLENAVIWLVDRNHRQIRRTLKGVKIGRDSQRTHRVSHGFICGPEKSD